LKLFTLESPGENERSGGRSSEDPSGTLV